VDNVSWCNKLFLIVVIIINVIFNAKYQLHYDEAYYWVFSQNLSWSYYDHPPLLAYLIRLCSIFGHNEFAVRLPALITATITIITIFKLAHKMYGKAVANVAMFLALCSPILQAIFFIVTPDSPLLMFWALTLYFGYMAIFENARGAIYLAGLCAGLGLLSKYTMVLMFPALFLFLLFSPQHRYWLAKPQLYLALLLSLLVFAPVIYWNYQHNWVSFIFQFSHGIDLTKQLNILSFTDYLGGQILLGGAAIVIALGYYLGRYFKLIMRDDRQAFLAWPCIFVLGFFGYRGLFQHMEANWAVVAYISGIILVAVWVNSSAVKWVSRVSFILVLVLLVVTKFPMSFVAKSWYNRNEIKIVNVFFGNNELLTQVRTYIPHTDQVFACDYGNAARAWFYWHGKPQVRVLDKFKFAHMFQYWNEDLHYPLKHAVYICDNKDEEAMSALKQYFTHIELESAVEYHNPVGSKVMYIYSVSNANAN